MAISPELEFLLVVRHGRDPVPVACDPTPFAVWLAYEQLAEAGDRRDIWDAASTLEQLLREDLRPAGIDIRTRTVWCSDRADPRVESASALMAQACTQDGEAPGRSAGIGLGPRGWPPISFPWRGAETECAIEHVWECVRAVLDENDDCNAVVLVGNQPAIDWFLDGQVDASVAVAAGEIVCLVRDSKPRATHGQFGGFLKGLRHGRIGVREYDWHLWWSITPSASSKTQELREKVQSKMVVLSVLAGFTVAVLAATLLDLPRPPENQWWALAAVASFALATALFTGTLFAYDQLMMPSRWWVARRPRTRADPLTSTVTWRPPAADSSVIHQESLRLWSWVTLGVLLAGLGVVLLAISAVWGQGGWTPRLPVICVAAAVILAAVAWWRAARPALGSED